MILKDDPSNETALYWLARAYAKLGRFGDSIDCASEAIAIDHSYIDPYVIMVYSLFCQSQGISDSVPVPLLMQKLQIHAVGGTE